MKLEFSRQFFENYSNIKSHETRPVGTEFYVDGWTDGQADMRKRTVAFAILRTRLMMAF